MHCARNFNHFPHPACPNCGAYVSGPAPTLACRALQYAEADQDIRLDPDHLDLTPQPTQPRPSPSCCFCPLI